MLKQTKSIPTILHSHSSVETLTKSFSYSGIESILAFRALHFYENWPNKIKNLFCLGELIFFEGVPQQLQYHHQQQPKEMSDLSSAVTEQVPVGTAQILESSHVSQGPGRIAKAPVPSIYVDDRGDIHRLRVGHQRINLLFSKASVMRSGYLHPHTMEHVVISGKVEVWTLTKSGTVKTIYTNKQAFQIDPWTPHILYFLEDSVVAEWWGAGTEFQCYYYHPFRKIIDVQNSLIARDEAFMTSQMTGRNQRLIPQDEVGLAESDSRLSVRIGTFLLVVAGTMAGVVAGIAIGLTIGEKTEFRRKK